MKELIKQAFDQFFLDLDKIIPDFKLDRKSIRIDDFKLNELIAYVKTFNIPDNAFFDVFKEQDDFLKRDYVNLVWHVKTPLTIEEKNKIKQKYFELKYFQTVSDVMIANGYCKKPIDLIEINKLSIPSYVYKMYIENDYINLEKYFSNLFYKKENKV